MIDTHDHADHVSGRVRLAQATGGAQPTGPARARTAATDVIAAGDEIIAGSVASDRGGHARATGPSTSPSSSPTSAAAPSRGCCSPATRCSSATSPVPISRSRPTGGRPRAARQPAPPARPRRPRRGVARPHRRLAVRRRRPERQVELHDRLRAPPQPAVSGSTRTRFVEGRHGAAALAPAQRRADRRAQPPLRRAPRRPSPRLLTGDALLSMLGTGATVLDSRAPADVRRRARGRLDQPAGLLGGRRHPRRLGARPRGAGGDRRRRRRPTPHRMAVGAAGGRLLEARWASSIADRRGVAAPLGARRPRGLLGSRAARRRRCATHSVDLVDVREPSEWVAGHVPGSHHVPLQPPARRRVDRPAPARPHHRGGLRRRDARGLRRQPAAPRRAPRRRPRRPAAASAISAPWASSSPPAPDRPAAPAPGGVAAPSRR